MSALKTRKRNILLQSDDEIKSLKSQSMIVAVRIRPLSQREQENGHTSCCNVINGNIVTIRKEGNASMYLRSQQGRLTFLFFLFFLFLKLFLSYSPLFSFLSYYSLLFCFL